MSVTYMGKVRMEKMEKLKPCPLCGRRAIIERWASGGMMYKVKCGNPDCAVPTEGYPSGRDLKVVKEQWNRRTSDKEDTKC